MPYGATPPDQRVRPIGFRLSGGGAAGLHMMAVNPEDLNWGEPTRLTAQNTLGGAWADHWDRAIATIRIAGNTGWRPPGSGGGGEAAFVNLRDTVFEQWNTRRTELARGGADPDVVRLDFVDALDLRAALVAPMVFQLKRNKASPLLQRYNIELIVLADLGSPGTIRDAVMDGLNTPLAFLGGSSALEALADGIESGLDALGELFL